MCVQCRGGGGGGGAFVSCQALDCGSEDITSNENHLCILEI